MYTLIDAFNVTVSFHFLIKSRFLTCLLGCLLTGRKETVSIIAIFNPKDLDVWKKFLLHKLRPAFIFSLWSMWLPEIE